MYIYLNHEMEWGTFAGHGGEAEHVFRVNREWSIEAGGRSWYLVYVAM